jgi:hypothetical protein
MSQEQEWQDPDWSPPPVQLHRREQAADPWAGQDADGDSSPKPKPKPTGATGTSVTSTRVHRVREQTVQQKQQRQRTEAMKQKKQQKRQQVEQSKQQLAADLDIQRIKNVCTADRTYANGGLNIDDMMARAAAHDLDIGSGTRAEIRMALCKEFYPSIIVTPTTLSGSQNIKVPGQKQKVKQYKNILPTDEDIKQRMQRFCAFNSSYSSGGWNSDQAREIALWLGINTKNEAGKEIPREDLRGKICQEFNKYTKTIYTPLLYDETPTAQLSMTFDTEKLRPIMKSFAAQLVDKLRQSLATQHVVPGISYFYSFTKSAKQVAQVAQGSEPLKYAHEKYPIISLMQGPLDVEHNPAPRALPDQKTIIDHLYELVPVVYVNNAVDSITLNDKEGYTPIPVDFAILEEHGHVNVYAIWDILKWTRKAKRIIRKHIQSRTAPI